MLPAPSYRARITVLPASERPHPAEWPFVLRQIRTPIEMEGKYLDCSITFDGDEDVPLGSERLATVEVLAPFGARGLLREGMTFEVGAAAYRLARGVFLSNPLE